MWRPMSLFMLLRFLLCVWKVRIPYRKGVSWGMCSLLITTSKKYYIIIFTRTVREAFQRNIRQKQNLNLICFVSFKNQNWEMYCLLQPFWPVTTIVFGIFRLGQISHTISLGSRGIEGGVRENDAYCFLLRMAHFLIFIHNGGIWKGIIQPRMVFIFLVTKVFQKGTMFRWVTVQLSHEMLRHAMVSDKPGGLSVHPPTSPGKLNWQHSKNHLLAILVTSIDLDAIFIAVPVEHYTI